MYLRHENTKKRVTENLQNSLHFPQKRSSSSIEVFSHSPASVHRDHRLVSEYVVDRGTTRDIHCGKTHMHSVEEVSEAGLGQVSIEVARQHEHLYDESSSVDEFYCITTLAVWTVLLECNLTGEHSHTSTCCFLTTLAGCSLFFWSQCGYIVLREPTRIHVHAFNQFGESRTGAHQQKLVVQAQGCTPSRRQRCPRCIELFR